MATFKTTRKLYPEKYENGFTLYHKTNALVDQICGKYSFEYYPNYDRIKFITDATYKYFDKRNTWAWFKCYIPARFVEMIIKELLSDYVEHYAICTHDMDNSPIHTHVLLKFYRNQSYITNIVEYFHADNISDPIHKIRHCWDYLRHDSKQCRKEGKFQYKMEDVITDSVEFFENFVGNDDNYNVALQIIDDILNDVKERDLVSRYGREYILYRQRYHDTARIIASQESEKLKDIEIHSITADVLAVYDKRTGQLVSIARSLDEIRFKEGLSV